MADADLSKLDNASLAQLLEDEVRFRRVVHGDMTPVMREAARRLREMPGDRIGRWERAKPLEACPHCQRLEPVDLCHMAGCPMGGDF